MLSQDMIESKLMTRAGVAVPPIGMRPRGVAVPPIGMRPRGVAVPPIGMRPRALSGMPELPAYRPRLYSLFSRSRFRQYGGPGSFNGTSRVRTSIPGAGYRGKRMVWAEQPLMLGGLGQAGSTALTIMAEALQDPDGTLRRRGPALATALDRYVLGPALEQAGRRLAPVMLKYAVPPYILLLALGLASAYFGYRTVKKLGA